MAHILILTVSFPEIPLENIEAKLDNALDWIRYAPGCWLIYTEHSAHRWYGQLFELPELAGSLIFLAKVELADHSGRLSPEAWDWITKTQREESSASVPDEQTVGAM